MNKNQDNPYRKHTAAMQSALRGVMTKRDNPNRDLQSTKLRTY